MRDFLNAILTFIGSTSLTNDEFDALAIESAAYDVATYEALYAVLGSRESVSGAADRLKYYFLAKGVQVTAPVGQSNIYAGGVLCD